MKLLDKDRTRLWFLEALERARRQHEFDLWAYVLMPEHAHILLCPRGLHYEIAGILKSMKQSVSRRAVLYLKGTAPNFLGRLEVKWPDGRREHRFWQQGGGYDRNILKPETAWKAIEYIHNNPVRRGLVDSPTDWEWSSARWYAGMENVRLVMDGCPPTPAIK
jgi:putative transposase